MKRIHLRESQVPHSLMAEAWVGMSAGTDYPHYVASDGTEYEGFWGDQGAWPFGFWPMALSAEANYKFFVGEESATHQSAMADAAIAICEGFVEDMMYDDGGIDEIEAEFQSFANDAKRYGYTLRDDGTYVSEDGEYEGSLDNIYDEFNLSYSGEELMYRLDASEYARRILEGGNPPTFQEIEDVLYNDLMGEIERRKGALEDDKAINELGESVGIYNLYQRLSGAGQNQGRIWTDQHMFGFYNGAEPSPARMEQILIGLTNNDFVEASYDEMLDYMVVFTTVVNGDVTVTGCTARDYMAGNYGEGKVDKEAEQEYRYNAKPVIPVHLARPEEKQEYFQDFRDTRDKALYAPREKGGNGTLAGYHAMRHPYGESKKITGKKLL